MSEPAWQAVATSASLKGKPLPVIVEGRPLVLFRSDAGLHALTDRCPHRGAPLSGGRVVAGLLECPYHGWRFDGSGRCRAMPGLLGTLPTIATASAAVTEAGGLIFVAARPNAAAPYVSVLSGGDTVSTIVESKVGARVLDVAENILDATHTHFTHRLILRGLSSRRYRVHVTVTGGAGWVEARYEGEPRQHGLISRLLEGERSIGIGRFLYPGIAELEFWGRSGITLATTFHLRQETPDTVHGFGILSGPLQGGFGHLKAALFKPFFRIALQQDRRILEAASRNRLSAGDLPPVVTPLDVMRPHIAAILNGEIPSVADTPQTLVMEL